MAAFPCDALLWCCSTGSRPFGTGIDVIYSKEKKKRYDLRTSYTHEKGNSINTINLILLSPSGRINLHDDSFQSESLCKPVKNSQTALKTPGKLF